MLIDVWFVSSVGDVVMVLLLVLGIVIGLFIGMVYFCVLVVSVLFVGNSCCCCGL